MSKKAATTKTKTATTHSANFGHPPIEAYYLSKPVHLQTRRDRYEAGRAMRVTCPRDLHSSYSVDWEGRRDPMDILIESNERRVNHLLPIRYGRMLSSPFAFFRGAASIMAADLAQTPSTGYAVQACGDCHLMNFGAFATPERNIVFDINDFDETYPAPWEWDLKRLAASFVIASRHNGHKRSDARAAAARLVQCYSSRMKELSEMKTLDAWYSFLDYHELIDLTSDSQLKKRRKKVLEKAMSRDALAEFVKLGHVVGGRPRIKDQPPLIYHDEDHDTEQYRERIRTSLERYRESLPVERRILFDRYEMVDNALKVVGVGSVGTVCGIALFFAAEGDPLFLQVKEARASVLQPYCNLPAPDSNGERVVTGQRLMQAASDLFLGHYIGDSSRHFYVRQLRDVKVKPLVEIFNAENMLGFARNCGWALARAHARSGDPAVLRGYIGGGDALPLAIAEFADRYADQNELDHKKLVDAIRSGAIEADTEWT
jgi:uncharacterized protein (DUF2252 family)